MESNLRIRSNRIAKWDNLKFYMILLVVVGHVTGYFLDYSSLAKGVYLFIYSFHMPVFIFISGLMSKNAVHERRYETVFQYLVIYIVMKFLETFGNYLATGKTSFHVLWESGPAWFALAVAMFLIAAMLLQNMNTVWVMGAGIFVGCVAGLDTHMGDHFASMRILVFFPVFMAGYYCDMRKLLDATSDVWQIVIKKIVSLVVLLGLLVVFLTNAEELYPLIRLFKGKYEYGDMEFLGSDMAGIVYRLACYLMWGILILAVINLTSSAERIYTWLGKRTMAIFIWHTFVIILVMKVFAVKSLLLFNLQHTFVIGGVCIGIIITVLCAYLPELRIKSSRKN